MSALFAVALTLCQASIGDSTKDECDTYVIAVDDTWHNKRRCFNGGLRPLSDEFANVWPNDVRLKDWLAQYDITTPTELITDYDFTCERVDER